LVRSYPSQAMTWSSPPEAACAGSVDNLNRNAPPPKPAIPVSTALLLTADVNKPESTSSPALRVVANSPFLMAIFYNLALQDIGYNNHESQTNSSVTARLRMSCGDLAEASRLSRSAALASVDLGEDRAKCAPASTLRKRPIQLKQHQPAASPRFSWLTISSAASATCFLSSLDVSTASRRR
jgi:hypothetical protein